MGKKCEILHAKYDEPVMINPGKHVLKYYRYLKYDL